MAEGTDGGGASVMDVPGILESKVGPDVGGASVMDVPGI